MNKCIYNEITDKNAGKEINKGKTTGEVSMITGTWNCVILNKNPNDFFRLIS